MKIHLYCDGKQRGPFSVEEINEEICQGNSLINPSTLAMTEEGTGWIPLAQVPGIVLAPTDPQKAAEFFAQKRAERERNKYSFEHNPFILNRVVTILLLTLACVGIFALLSDLWHLRLLDSSFTPKQAELNDLRQQIVWAVFLGVLGITASSFLFWIFKTNKNCRGLGAQGMLFTPKWAVGCYFFPFLKTDGPHEVLQEIWQVSKNPGDWKSQKKSFLLQFWWTLFFVFWLATAMIFPLAWFATSPQFMAISLQFFKIILFSQIVFESLVVLLALATYFFVFKIAKKHQQLSLIKV